ncbi:hypothetical protein MFLAVUS_001389 [Mucor flavus]|uniref:Uncharacterized protein n=1 Tax=Mucor flavus TaxID=439312 RepID=A0ABP9YME4_9FUNG
MTISRYLLSRVSPALLKAGDEKAEKLLNANHSKVYESAAGNSNDANTTSVAASTLSVPICNPIIHDAGNNILFVWLNRVVLEKCDALEGKTLGQYYSFAEVKP